MSLNRIIAREMAKSNGKIKIIHGKVIGNVSPEIEWIKWLSYESEFEKKRIEYLDSKKESELSYEELKEASRYKRNKYFAKLFKIYGTSECSKEDYMKVYNFMCDESIENLMLSKLTREELQYTKQEIARLSNLPKEQLSSKVKEKQKDYEQLSMVDSYILHIISNIDYARNMHDLNRKIYVQLQENEAMRQRSLYHALNPYKRS